MGNRNFLKGGDALFKGESNAVVVNLGRVGSLGGNVVLMAADVRNDGTIRAPKGTAGLIAGRTILMRDTAGREGSFLVQRGGADTASTNTGAIEAAQAELRAEGGNVYALAGNTDGIVRATGVANREGKIFLTAGDGGKVTVSGTTLTASNASGDGGAVSVTGGTVTVAGDATLDVSATAGQGSGGSALVIADMSAGTLYFRGQALARGGSEGGDGGLVETSGANVDFRGARMNTTASRGRTGNWLIDPFDLTVDSSAATTINTNLASSDVTLATTAVGTTGPGTANASGNGDIFINAPLSWSSGTTLTLNAYRSIGINANITAGGQSKVVMVTNNGGSGGDYSFGPGASLSFPGVGGGPSGQPGLTINGNVYTLIAFSGPDPGIEVLNGKTSGYYALARDFAGAMQGIPIVGTFGDPTTKAGLFTGLGHSFDNYTIAMSSGNGGIFGTLYGTVRDLNITNSQIKASGGASNFGLVAGAMTGGTIKNVHVSGTSSVRGLTFSDVPSTASVFGGLVGLMTGGTISNSSSTATISTTVGGNNFGGLVGSMAGGSITGSFSTGAVSNVNGTAGGLVGGITTAGSAIANSYATGAITSSGGSLGGLVGHITGGTAANQNTINNSYATGPVNGSQNVGGLIGTVQPSTVLINDSYATGPVTGTTGGIGGLVGSLTGSSAPDTIVNRSYATGNAVATDPNGSGVGGLMGGATNVTINTSFSTGSATGTSYTGGLIGNAQGSVVLSDVYAQGAVTGTRVLGGLVGDFSAGGNSLTNGYASGAITASGDLVGGLIGLLSAPVTVTNGYWDMESTGRSTTALNKGTGMTTSALQNGTLPSGFNTPVTANGNPWQATPGFYPYFGYQYSGGAQVISGTAYTAGGSPAGGAIVRLYKAGSLLQTVTTKTGTGAYSALVALNSITGATPLGGTLALSGAGNTIVGAAYANPPAFSAGNVVNFDLTANLFKVTTTDPTHSALLANLAQTFGSANYATLASTLNSATLRVNAANAFTIDTAINRAGAIAIQAGGGIKIASGGSVTSTAAGDAVVLAANGGFINSGGANAISASNGRWLVYSQAPGSPTGQPDFATPGGLVGKSYYGDAYNFNTGTFATAPNAGNRFVYGYRPALTASPDTKSVVYNGAPQTDTYSFTGYVSNADRSADVITGSATGLTTPSKNVGGYALTANGSLASDLNYSISYGSGMLTITAKELTAGLTGTVSKVYNTTTAAALAGANYTLNGVLAPDSVVLNNPASGTYADKNAGTGKSVSVTGLSISGADAANYTVNASAMGNVGTILKAPATLTPSAVDKPYDGTTTSTGTVTPSGLLGADTLTSATQAYNSRNAGTQTISVGAYTINDGNSGNNYDVTRQTASGSIAKANLTISATTASKPYDGGTSSTGSLDVTGLRDTDTVTGRSQVYDQKNAGSRTLQVATYTVNDGNSGQNYNVTTQTAAGTINQAPLTAGLTGTVVKPYDGTDAATLAAANYTLSGVVGSEVVTLNNPASGTYANRNAGTGKSVSVTGLALGGADAANYTVNSSASGNIGTINQKALTLAAVPSDKTYNGTTASTGTVAVTGLVGTDTVTGQTQIYGSKNAGTQTLSVTGYTVNDGNSGNNYSVSTQTSSGTIAKAPLTIAAVPDTKTYNATTASAGVVNVTGLQGTDTVTAAQTFDTKNAGSRTLSVNSPTINDGNSGNNYNVTTQTAVGTINQAPLTAGLTGTVVKPYDGTDAATLAAGNYTLSGVVGSEAVTLNNPASGTYGNRNAGTGKSVSVAGLALGGADAANYTVNSTASANIGTINPKALTLAAVPSDKTYNGTTASSGTVTVTGLVGTDTVTGQTQIYGSKNAGTQTLSVTGYTVNDGNSGNNYSVSTQTSSGTIAKAPLTIAAVPDTKTYNATTASAGVVNVTGLQGADTVTAVQTFDTKNAGARTLSVNSPTINDGNSGNNYNLTLQTADGTINRAPLTAGLTGTVVKPYDGTDAATLAASNYTLSGVLGSEAVTLNNPASGTYADRNAGTGKSVSVAGLALGGADAANYTVNPAASANIGTINQKALTLAAVTSSKDYDATTASSGTVMVTGLVGSDTVTGQTQVFDSKNAGPRTLSVIGYTVNDGNSGGNYAVTAQTASGSIAKKALTLAATPDSKPYDATNASAGTVNVTGLVGPDTVTGQAQTFDSKNAGSRTLSVTGYTINDGNHGGNYAVTAQTAAGTIAQAPLTLAATPASRSYDGTTASPAPVTVTGLKGTDTVTGQTQTYDSKNAGSRTLSVGGYTINDGNSGGNYLVSTQTAAGTIDKAVVTLNFTGSNVTKVYDGTTTATLNSSSYTLSGVAEGESVTANGQPVGHYSDKNAGTGKTLTVTGLELGGEGSNNYSLAASTSASVGVIQPAPLTLAATADNKTYDGTAASPGAVTVSGLIGSDTVTGTAQSYDSKNAGSRTLGVSAYTINDGNNGGNYAVTAQTAAGTIAKTPLTLSATAANKSYDGTTASNGPVTVAGLKGADTVTGQSQVYDSKDAGSRTLSVAGYTINDGNNGGNYTVGTQTAAGTINRAVLTLNFTGSTVSKVYDGTTAATLSPSSYSLSGVVEGENVTPAGPATAHYSDKNAGGGKTLTVTGVELSGSGSSNYTISTSTTADVGVIQPAVLTLAATPDTKTYDGTSRSSGPVNVSGLVGSDTVTGHAQSYDSKDAGTRTLDVSAYTINDGNNGRNYVVTTQSAGGSIGRAALTLTAAADTKTYDGTTQSSGTVSVAGLVGSDTISGQTQSFDSRNAGTRTLGVSGYVINDGNDGRNYNVTTQTAAGAIRQAALTVAASPDSKPYDGNSASSAPVTVTGLVGTDTIPGLAQTYDSKNAGNRTLTVNGPAINDGNGGNNYVVTTQSAPGTITPAALTALLTGTVSKVYDGNNSATLTPGNYNLTGVVGGEAVTINTPASGSYSDRNAGTGKTVTVTGLALSGAGAGNYTLNGSASGNIGTITPAALRLTASSDSKTYDGTNASAGTVAVSGLVASDTISAPTQTFDSRNAGSRTIDVTGYTINDGNNGGNYTVSTHTAQGVIHPAQLTIRPTGGNKPYDGTNASNGPVVGDGLKGSDTVSGTQAYGSKNVGDHNISVGGGTVVNDGNGGRNYTVTTQTAPGAITPAPLSARLTGNISKVYDGTASAVLTPGNYTLSGVVGGESVTINTPAAGVYDNKNAGSGKTVSAGGMILSGPDAGNYALDSTATGLVGTIVPAPLTMVASGGNKTYDGTAVAPGTVNVTGLIGSDTVAAVAQSYESKNVGTWTIGVSGHTINDGNNGGNYTVTTQSASGTISPANLTVAANPVNKTYDGTTASAAALNITGLMGTDTVTGQSQTYESKNVGTWTLRIGDFTVNDGNNGANYIVATQSATGTISPAMLTAALTGSIAKGYDGTTGAILTPGHYNLLGVVGGEDVGITTPASANYENKNAGTGKAVIATGMTLSGAGAGNYLLNPIATGNIGTITPAALTLTASGGNKTYDGTVNSAGAIGVAGLAGSDTIAGQTQTYDSRNVGARTLAVTGYTINDGNGGGNYTVTTQSAAGAITPAPLTVALTGTTSKVYDGTTAATLTPGNYALNGVVGGDAISLNAPKSGTYVDHNPGTGKTVLASGLTIGGEGAGNYLLNPTASGNIGTIMGGASTPSTVAPTCPTGAAILPVFNTTNARAAGGTCWIPLPAIDGGLTVVPTNAPSAPYPPNQRVSTHILFVGPK